MKSVAFSSILLVASCSLSFLQSLMKKEKNCGPATKEGELKKKATAPFERGRSRKQINSSSLSGAVRNEWEEEVFCLLAEPVMGGATR